MSKNTIGVADPEKEREIVARLERVPFKGMMVVYVLTLGMAVLFDFANDMSLSYVAPTLQENLGFTVDNIAFLVSTTLFGTVVGAWLGGRIADRVGRMRVLRWSLFIGSAGTMSFALIDGVAVFVVLRFLSGVALGALYIVAITYLIEISPRAQRNARTAFVGFFGTASVVVISAFARVVVPLGDYGWRLVFIFGGVGLLFLLPMKLMPESPLWLVSRGRNADAEAAMQALERGHDLPEYTPERLDQAASPTPAGAASAARTDEADEVRPGKYVDLFRGRLVVPTSLLMALWTLYIFVAVSFNVWLPTMLSLRGFSTEQLLTISFLGTIGQPVGALSMIVITRFIRRWIAMCVVSAIGILAAFVFATTSVTVVLSIAAFMMMFTFGAFVPLANLTTAEEYPAALRASGAGFTYGFGRLVNVAGPFLISTILAAVGAAAVSWLLAAIWAAVAVIALAIRFRPGPRIYIADAEEDQVRTGVPEPKGATV
ncbi:MFS transporter [Gordonia mangrovi]|uniref:MFS transporter n=1 Tax=Gordonia mangrovi TaxID=2665643 RepID=UPI00136FED39|nr:MFS transporter [Gordonia mangrovi]UVF76681.1 MFS transporter [Gordonia mangrovi]